MLGAFRINTLAKAAPAGAGGVSYTFRAPSPNNINETGTTFVNFTFDTTGVPDNTLIYVGYSINGGAVQYLTPNSDWDASTTITVTGNTGSPVFAALPDTTTEGTETVVCKLFSDAGRTLLLATSDPITVNDTSKTPPAFTFFNSSSSLGSLVQFPANILAGDLAIIIDTSTTVTNTVPSGWTAANSVSTTGIRTTISYKTCLGTESSTQVTGMGGVTRKILLVFRPDITVNSISPVFNTGQATTSAPTQQTLGLLSIAKPHIVIAAYAKTISTTPTRGFVQSGATGVIEQSSVSTSGVYVKYQINNVGSNPQTTTLSMTDAGTNTLQSGTFRFT